MGINYKFYCNDPERMNHEISHEASKSLEIVIREFCNTIRAHFCKMIDANSFEVEVNRKKVIYTITKE